MSKEWNAVYTDDRPFYDGQRITNMDSYRPRKLGLSHETIDSIIRQKQRYLAFKQELDERIWGDEDFRPGPMVEKIADKLTLTLVKDATELLETTCDQFIDCLVHSEFFPE
jgi:hypothetical protein